MTVLTPDTAALYARTALGHVTREWPYKMDHVFTGPHDVMAPRDAHPIFFGSFRMFSAQSSATGRVAFDEEVVKA